MPSSSVTKSRSMQMQVPSPSIMSPHIRFMWPPSYCPAPAMCPYVLLCLVWREYFKAVLPSTAGRHSAQRGLAT